MTDIEQLRKDAEVAQAWARQLKQMCGFVRISSDYEVAREIAQAAQARYEAAKRAQEGTALAAADAAGLLHKGGLT